MTGPGFTASLAASLMPHLILAPIALPLLTAGLMLLLREERQRTKVTLNITSTLLGLVVAVLLLVQAKDPHLPGGLGVYLPFYMSLTAFLGSCVKLAYDKWSAHRDATAGLSDEERAAKDAAFQEQGLVVASGLLGGESIVGVILAFVSVGLSLLG